KIIGTCHMKKSKTEVQAMKKSTFFMPQLSTHFFFIFNARERTGLISFPIRGD
ncbi:hypothetical protein ACJX0J_021970, partial [Zea mays]